MIKFKKKNKQTLCWNGSVTFTMTVKLKQIACIKLCTKLNRFIISSLPNYGLNSRQIELSSRGCLPVCEKDKSEFETNRDILSNISEF